ncbi:MAG: OmpA family protein [Taibaiella sp.]|jgi:outer membrane protein OmpA-like peptidoglycan-associated protein
MLRYLLLLFFVAILRPCQAQYFDTIHIHYDIGVAGLQKKDKSMLDSVAKHTDTRKMLIYSYADYLGSEKPNQHLSDNRAIEVKNYLLKKGIAPEQIMECTGLGKVEGSGGSDGDVTFRRTDIFIRKDKPKGQVAVSEKEQDVIKSQTPLQEKVNQSIPVPQEQEGVPPRVTNIDLSILKVNETVNLTNLFFYPGRVDIITSSYSELDNLYNVMKDNPKLKIRLEGHVCCCVYPDGFFKNTPTWGLSVDRAFTVYNHLIKRGIGPERMQYDGFGRTKPIRENERTEEEGQVNRRVEVRILEK